MLAVLVGYFANLLVPRMGEFSRCAVLKKTDNVEISSGLGSVVVERAFDMISLVVVILLSLFVEYEKLITVLTDIFAPKIDYIVQNTPLLASGLIIIIAIVLLSVFVVSKKKTQLRRNTLLIKIRSFFRDLVEGILSIRKIKNKTGFWISTATLWLAYFFMAYVIFFAFEPTSSLGLKAGLSVLIMGGLGMATPVQGGVGAYHILVSGVLILYGISEEDGKFFAFVVHTSQFLSLLAFGGMSFVISLFIPKRVSKIESIRA